MFRFINIFVIIIVANKVSAYGTSTEVENTSYRTNFINKCCPTNLYIGRGKRCTKSEKSYSFSSIEVYDDYMRKMEKSFDEVLTLSPGKFEDVKFRLESMDANLIGFNVHVMQTGDLKLELPNTYNRWLNIDKENVCVDYRLRSDRASIRYYVILPPMETVEYNPLSKLGLLLTCFFLLLVIIINAMLPELHDLCGKIQIAFVFSFFLAFLNLAVMHFKSFSAENCINMTALTYYFALSSFFWLTVMAFDIWWTFRSFVKARPIRRNNEKKKLVLYCIYANGVPILITIGLVIMNEVNMSRFPWFITPRVPENGCYLDGGSKVIYLDIPMLFQIFWNLLFLILAAFEVRRLKRRTALLDTAATGSLQAQHTQKMRFMVYLKLTVVMVFYWLFDLFYDISLAARVWYITDIYRSIVGFMIFLILVCKSHIFKMLCNRYGCHKSTVPKAGLLSKIQSENEPMKTKQEKATA